MMADLADGIAAMACGVKGMLIAALGTTPGVTYGTRFAATFICLAGVPSARVGMGIGVVIVILDEVLGKAGKMRLPPLGVGMGIYLPMSLTLLIPIGALIGKMFDRFAARQRDPEQAQRLGVLIHSECLRCRCFC